MSQAIDRVLTVSALRDARKLLSQPCAWTQGSYARDARGSSIRASEPGACSWCVQGALFKVLGVVGSIPTSDVRQVQAPLLQHAGVIDTADLWCWNDQPGRTQNEVLALFDKAIAAEESQL
jgi:hypothetical protein